MQENCYVSRDHEEIKCQAVPIKAYYPRRSITFQIVSDNHTNPVDSGTFVVGYASPNVSGLAGHSNLQTRGGETVVVKGKNFGMPMNRNVSIRTRRPDGFIVHWKNCSIESDTLILCQSEEGQGSQLQMKVIILDDMEMEFFNATEPYFRYASPTITNLAGHLDMPILGYTYVNITGTNFGPIYADINPSAWYGNNRSKYYSAKCTKTVAHTRIDCKVTKYNTPADGSNERNQLNWIISISNQESDSTIFSPTLGNTTSYAKPKIFGIFNNSRLNTAGGDQIIFRGQNLGTGYNILKSMAYGPIGNLSHYAISIEKCEVHARIIKCPSAEADVGVLRTGHLFDIDIDGYNTSVVDAYALVSGHVGKETFYLHNSSMCEIPIHHRSKCEEAFSIMNKSHTPPLSFEANRNRDEPYGCYLKDNAVVFNDGGYGSCSSDFQCICTSGFGNGAKSLVSDNSTSYGKPSIDAIVKDSSGSEDAKIELSTAGGTRVILKGDNFGPAPKNCFTFITYVCDVL